MINSTSHFIFRELNEIVGTIYKRLKTIESRSNLDNLDDGWEWSEYINLLQNLEFIKEKLRDERWMLENLKKEEKFQYPEEYSEYSLFRIEFAKIMETADELVAEMVKNNDCDVATKVSRTLMKLAGKAFQGIVNLMIV